MTLTFHDLDKREFYRFFRMDIEGPIFGYAVRDGIKTVCIGGIMFDEQGRAWGFLDFLPGRRGGWMYRYGVKIMQTARELGLDSVSVVRDARFNTSERLLERLGFKRTDEINENGEVWKWAV